MADANRLCHAVAMDSFAAAVTATKDGALLRLRVSPSAKTTMLTGIYGDAVKVRVAAPPTDGKANAALMDYLARVLDVPSRDLELIRGTSGRDKVVRVPGVEAQAVASRIQAAGR